MQHEKCSQNCSSMERKIPLSERIAQKAAETNVKGTFAAVAEKQAQIMALPITFLAPPNVVEIAAYGPYAKSLKPNVIRVHHKKADGKIYDVKLCFDCTEMVCSKTPNCEKKDALKKYLFEQVAVKQ